MAKADKLLEQAKEHFGAGESALAIVSGAYETKIGKHDTVRNGVLIATNQRLIFYAKKLTGFDLEALPYERISSLEMGKKLGGRWIKFFASGNTVSMKWIQDDLTAFINTVRSQMAGDSADEGADATLAVQPDAPAEGTELAAQEPKAEDEAPMTPAQSSGKASGGCFQVVVIAIGVLLGGIVVLVGLFAIFGPDEDATSSTGSDRDPKPDMLKAMEDLVEVAAWRTLTFADDFGESAGVGAASGEFIPDTRMGFPYHNVRGRLMTNCQEIWVRFNESPNITGGDTKDGYDTFHLVAKLGEERLNLSAIQTWQDKDVKLGATRKRTSEAGEEGTIFWSVTPTAENLLNRMKETDEMHSFRIVFPWYGEGRVTFTFPLLSFRKTLQEACG